MEKITKLGALITLVSGIGAMPVHASCEMDEVIKIADMSWASASAIAHIESRILEQGFGCKTQLIPGDTVPTATTMVRKGLPHIAPEMWSSNVRKVLEEGEQSGAITIAGDTYVSGGVDAWWVPRYVVDANPELKSVKDLARYSHLFNDPNDPDKGRFYNCPPGWACEVMSKNLLKGYGLDQHYNLFSPGSSAALDAAISSSYKRKKPILFFYWGPTALLGKYDMVQLEMTPHDPERDACNAKAECDNPTAGGFPHAEVNTVVSKELKEKAPSIYDFLAKVSLETDMVNSLLAWGDEHNAEASEIAEHFLENYQEVWTPWVSPTVADKVIASN
ncbi:ABC transporter substrate-binding protein [Oceanisphaera psychrotolerans]|uniref:ABC transporter substrate-binding protein n=1 Tax=Oceanisphaera psychrotolerans TaxID=1414654 RepID=UPI0009F578C4|nr:ABC transporter substrate-binding protein [Oceanisphaera psychrotolerans]